MTGWLLRDAEKQAGERQLMPGVMPAMPQGA